MKKMLKRASLMGAAAVLLASLWGCAAEPAEITEVPVLISGEDFGKYWIVRPEKGSPAEVDAGTEIRQAMKDRGLSLELTTDFYREGMASDYYSIRDCEILIGNTNRPETEKFMYSLQPWQYGYGYVDGKIVIAGHSDETLELAVDAFLSMVSAKDTLQYLETDGYIYGDVAEGEGRVYSVLNLTAEETADAASVLDSGKTPEVITAQCADREAAEALIAAAGDAYAVGADFDSADGSCHVILYNPSVYSFSSSALCPMSYLNYVPVDERGDFAYCVLRCLENSEKFVFCSVDISGLSEQDQAMRMQILADFAENSERLPIVIGGRFSHDAAMNVLLDAGQSDFARLAEAQVEGCLYGSFGKIVPSLTEQSGEGQIYCEFQKVMK